MTVAIALLGTILVLAIAWPYLRSDLFKKSPPPPPVSHVIRGHLTLVAARLDRDESNGCAGHLETGYSDIRPGKQVTVMDATGRVLGVGALGPGRLVQEHTCQLEF